MTNQNPAVPQSPQSGSSFDRDRDILAKVNAHADRSMDRLFADIDELLGDDLTNDPNSAPTQHSPYATEQYPQLQQPIDPPQRSLSAGADTPSEQPTTTAKPKRTMPLWIKAFLGIGVTAVAAGGLLTWLVNERKITLPQIDTSWLPSQSQQVSPQDAKFADYMRKSLAKIEATTQATLATNNNTPTPAATMIAPAPTTATPAAPVATTPTSTIVTATTPVTPTAVKPKIALVKTLPKGSRPSAIFEIDRQSKTVNVGQIIGKSNWSLVSVTKSEITIKRKGGEIRSVDVGQKF